MGCSPRAPNRPDLRSRPRDAEENGHIGDCLNGDAALQRQQSAGVHAEDQAQQPELPYRRTGGIRRIERVLPQKSIFEQARDDKEKLLALGQALAANQTRRGLNPRRIVEHRQRILSQALPFG